VRTVARSVAAVVFPHPPLGLENAITGMKGPPCRDVDGKRLPER
jgi:hypothetical protein